jgi:hypothetical protein
VASDNRHRSLLQFIKRLVDVPAGLSKDDLISFRSIASRQYPTLVPLIEEYIQLAERSDSDAPLMRFRTVGARERTGSKADQMHLFDLLREKKLFPSNSDLVEFAERILPDMRSYRYDKMSKSDIAARVLEYLETLDPRRKHELEQSMRNAMVVSTARSSDRRSFLSTWEKIIKGIEL